MSLEWLGTCEPVQTSVTFPAHASIEMYGIRFIFVCHKSEKAASKVIKD